MATPFPLKMEEGGHEHVIDATAGASKLAKQRHHRHTTGPVTYKDYASRVTHHPQSPAAGVAVSPRRSGPPVPERSVAAPVDMNAVDPKSPLRSRAGSANHNHPQLEGLQLPSIQGSSFKREAGSANEDRRDPPAHWEAQGPVLPSLPVEIPSASGTDANPSCHEEEGGLVDQRDGEEGDKAPLPIKSPDRRQFQRAAPRQASQPLTISTTSPPSPTAQQTVPSPSEANRFPYITSDDRGMSMSPAPSFTVNTEREGKKVVSQAEMSELIRSSIVKARQQAAASNAPGGAAQLTRATVVEIDPSTLRSNLRTALKQQTIGRPPQGPFPWSPILHTHAFASNPLMHPHHFDDLEMRSMGEWTEPSQLTEPSALLAMNDHIRYLSGRQGTRAHNFLVADRDELYEEVKNRQQEGRTGEDDVELTQKSPSAHSNSKRLPPESPSLSDLAKSGDVTNVLAGTPDQRQKHDVDEEPIRKLSLPTIYFNKREPEDISMVPHAAQDRDSGGTKSDDKVKKRHPRDPSGHDADKAEIQELSSDPPSSPIEDKIDEQDVSAEGTIAEDLLRNDLPDTIESLRHLRQTLSPRSGEKPEPNEDKPSLHEVHLDVGQSDPVELKLESSAADGSRENNNQVKDDIDADVMNTSGDLNAVIDIMSDRDIEKIVSSSMHKAQKTAKKEVQELLHESKRRKDNIVVKTTEGDKVLSKTEVADLIKESMARARETAQQEIAEMVKDSIRAARESAKEEIRAIVEESMRRARESTQREMQEFVKESFQRVRRSDASAVSVASSQGFTAADFTLASFSARQPSFGSGNPQVKSSQHGGYLLEHLSPLSEEEQNFNADAHDAHFCGPSDVASEPLQETEYPTIANVEDGQATGSGGGDAMESREDGESQKYTLEPEGNGINHDDDIGSSLMVLKNCTSPDVFHGLEEAEKRETPTFGEEKSTAGRVKANETACSSKQTKRVLLEPEEKLVELPTEQEFIHHSTTKDDPTEPSRGKDSISSRSVGQGPSVSLEDVEKAKEAVYSISETLRGLDEKKQKRIEDVALALLSPSDRSRLSKDGRRTGSKTRVETLIVSHKPKRYSSTKEDPHSRSSRESNSRLRKHDMHQSDKGSRRSDSDRSSRNSLDRASRKSSQSKHSAGSGRSKKSNTQSCAAESVIRQEFLARLSTPKANVKDPVTPKVQNLTSHPDDAEEDREARDGGGLKRSGSKDSAVTVPGNTFCLQFLTYLVNGGVGEESVAESATGYSAAVPRNKEAEGTHSPDAPPATTTPGGGLAALTPAAMFNQGSNWIDSLAQDMSSVLEGNDSTDVDTEGDTTFDDHDMSSYSQTDGEAEEEEEEEEFHFVMSNDDNSYNAGWWSERRRGPHSKRIAVKKPWRKRQDPGASLLD